MLFGQRRAARGHSTLDTGAVESDHIGVSLAHDHLIGSNDVAFSAVQAVQRLRLGVDVGLRRVLVLRRIVRTRQDPTAEGNRITVLRHDREHHPAAERVLQPTGFVGERQAGVAQRIARQPDTAAQRIPVVGRPAQLELTGDVAGQAALAQVVACRAGVVAGQQALVVPLDGRAHRLDQLLASQPVLALAARCVLQLNSCLGGQLLDGIDEVDVLDLLHEREDVAGRAAPEALVPTRSLRAR